MHTTAGTRLWSDKDKSSALLQEIDALERRLRAMGVDGDCAYERAMSRLYLSMVEERKRQLAELQGSLF